MLRQLSKYLLIVLFVCAGIGIINAATGTPSTLVVRTDANNYLLVSAVTQTNPVTQGVFASRTLRTDSSGSLQVVLTGTVTPTYPMAVPASTCAAPSLGESGAATTGIAFTATPSILNCISGTAVETITGSSISSTLPYVTASRYILGTNDSSGAAVSRNGSNIDITNGNNTLFSTIRALTGNFVTGSISTDTNNISSTVTWNAGGVTFTGWKLNVTDTASAAASLLMDLQVATASKFSVNKSGVVVSASSITASSGNIAASTGDITVQSTGAFYFITRSVFRSPANASFNLLNNGETFGLQLISGATAAPTFNNGTIDAGSRNSAGKVVLTGGNTGGTVTFATPNFTNAPFCTVTGTAATDVPQITSTSTSTLVVAGITANGTFYYLCIGRI